MKLPFNLELKRDTNYYFGLTLLTVAILSIVWAIWRDAFEPVDFLVYFLIYSWGYVLILKSDFELRIGNLERVITDLEAKLTVSGLENAGEKAENDSERTLEPEADDEFQPGLSVEAPTEEVKLFHEWKGEE